MGLSPLNKGEQWFDYYPVATKLGNTTDPSRTLLVDIGGGIGHDLLAFHQQFPSIPGKLIVQDLATVVASAQNLPPGIEAMSHDFFDPQPIKGAKAYYLRNVLHDWPDKQARQILESVREAMSGDSLLLINETVLPATKVGLYSAKVDFYMMAMFSSLNCTEGQFRALLGEAGFEVLGVWRPVDATLGSGTLIECGLTA